MLGIGGLAQAKARPCMDSTWKPIFCCSISTLVSSTAAILSAGSKHNPLIRVSTADLRAVGAGLCPSTYHGLVL